jgi:hypothetical protein
MEEELPGTGLRALAITAPLFSAYVAAGRGSHGGRGHPGRGGRSGRGLPNKCSACGSLDRLLSSYTASDAALMKWTLAKRKMIV